MRRAVHTVTLRPSGYTFTGYLFALHPGCWVVTRKVATEICEAYGFDLPRCGYDRMLTDTGYDYVTNISDAEFRVSLRWESYDHTPTGRFKEPPR